MKIEFKHLDEMYRAYAASALEIDGEVCALIASEEKGYPCYMYRGDTFDIRETVWESGGGCMSILQVPGRTNEFLANVDFYLKESPSHSKLIWGRYDSGKWRFKDLIHLPYLHRFDIFNLEGQNYVLLATIADDKDFKDDWSRSGSLYYAKLHENPEDGLMSLTRLPGHYTRNHGYYRKDTKHEMHGYFASDEGVFRITPHLNNPWLVEKIISGQIGEVALMDLKGDGNDAMITIEPFHGNCIRIYEKDQLGNYEPVYTYPYTIDFAHTLVGATLCGIPSFVGGVRRESSEIFIIQYCDNKYQERIIDAHAGPANLVVTQKAGRDVIVSANHTRNECAVYFITP